MTLSIYNIIWCVLRPILPLVLGWRQHKGKEQAGRCQDRYGLQPALYASANNGSRAGVSFLEVMERFKGTDAGKVVFKVQRDMEASLGEADEMSPSIVPRITVKN